MRRENAYGAPRWREDFEVKGGSGGEGGAEMAAGCGGAVEDDGGAWGVGHGADEGLPGGVEGESALRIGMGVEHQYYVEGAAAEVVGQRGGYGA